MNVWEADADDNVHNESLIALPKPLGRQLLSAADELDKIQSSSNGLVTSYFLENKCWKGRKRSIFICLLFFLSKGLHKINSFI